jgi:hypothetical protein
VLSSARTAYTSAEMQQMSDYFSANPGHRLPLPPTLAMITVVPVGWTCTTDLQVTNLGKTTVEVVSAGVRLTAASRTSQGDEYGLVDDCSLTGGSSRTPTPDVSPTPPASSSPAASSAPASPEGSAAPAPSPSRPTPVCLPATGGPPGGCTVFQVSIGLTAGSAGADFEGAPSPLVTARCGPIILQPEKTIEIRLTIGSGQAIIYPVEPVLTVVAPWGRQLRTVDDATGLLRFAATSQFTCYQRRGTNLFAALFGEQALQDQLCV